MYTGNTGMDTGNTGMDTGNTGMDTGNTGMDTGNTYTWRAPDDTVGAWGPQTWSAGRSARARDERGDA